MAISPYQKRIADTAHVNLKVALKTPRLLLTLHPKKDYVLHSTSLLWYLQHGAVLTKVHKAFKFTQAPFFKEFIEKNLEMRKQAKSLFARNLWKSASNSSFGKFLESPIDWVNVNIIQTRHDALKMISRPTFKAFTILDQEMSVIVTRKTKIMFDKFFHVGCAILDKSKIILYEFVYDAI